MNPDIKPERPKDKIIITKSSFPLTVGKEIIPKKILIKGKERKIFDSLNIPLSKKDNQKDTSTDKVN